MNKYSMIVFNCAVGYNLERDSNIWYGVSYEYSHIILIVMYGILVNQKFIFSLHIIKTKSNHFRVRCICIVKGE